MEPQTKNSKGRIVKRLFCVIGLIVATYLIVQGVSAQRVQLLGSTVSEAQQIPLMEINHAGFDRLLKKYVNEDGMVNYKAWESSEDDRAALIDYLKSLSEANPAVASSEASRLAFWINAYNAVTIEGILQKYPTSSIRNHTSPALGYNIWKHLKLQVGGDAYSLNSIEHDILRKLDEPRIHFAIVCASIGCPRLLNEAYTAENLDEQLGTNARHFFSQKSNLEIDAAGSTISLSSIINWFGTDFGKDQASQLKYLKAYFPDDAREIVESSFERGINLKIHYLDYDWNLNEQKE